MMRDHEIANVKRLAGEVADLCDQVKRDLDDEGLAYLTGSKTTAALRRRSMDLTRALADLRRY